MGSVVGTSIIAAFIAGIAALLAPCCITVLLPSYLANVFRERLKVMWMTFVFFLGILTVFLPIGLGASGLTQAFQNYHNTIFLAGGAFLILLGLFMIFGKGFRLPLAIKINLKRYVNSIYLLGIFSAIATMCCAPVLAGVFALSAASGNLLWGGVYTLAYVLGMVVPLFVIAAFLDRVDLTAKFMSIKRTTTVQLGRFVYKFVIADVIAGLVFLSMGIYIVYLAVNNRLLMQSEYQLGINLALAQITGAVKSVTGFVPDVAWAVIMVAMLILIITLSIKSLRYEKK